MRRRLFLLGLSGVAGCTRDARPRLNVCNWSNYVAPDTVPRFEREFGVRVRYAVYESNEELLAKIASGNSGWDVVFPTHYLLQPLRAQNLLARLDHRLLPNLRHLDPLFRHPWWDPDLAYGVPYMWGSTGILYRQEAGPITGWQDLWDTRLQGRITMLDDPAEVFAASLRRLGLSVNAAEPAALYAAFRQAQQQKPLLRAYSNAEVRDQVVAGDVLAAQLWATTAQQAVAETPQLRFVHPREGFPLYADQAVVLRESQRASLAHEFINYLLEPRVAAEAAAVSQAATANASAQALLPEPVRTSAALYPTATVLVRSEWFTALPPSAQRLRDRLWAELKSF